MVRTLSKGMPGGHTLQVHGGETSSQPIKTLLFKVLIQFMSPLCLVAAAKQPVALHHQPSCWAVFSILCGALLAFSKWQASAVCTNPPPGLVNWWRAENSGADIAGSYPGILLNGTTYGGGRVG